MRAEVAIGVIEFVANQLKTLDIKNQGLLRELQLTLSGNLVTGAGAGGGVVPEDDPYTLIEAIALRDGTRELQRWKPKQLLHVNTYDYAGVPSFLANGNAAAATLPFSAVMKIPEETLLASVPELTLLETPNYDNLNIAVYFKDELSLLVGGVYATKVVTGCTVSVKGAFETESRVAYLPFDREFPVKEVVGVFQTLQTGFSGQVPNLKVNPGKKIRRIFLFSYDNGVRADLADSDKVEVILDGTTRLVDTTYGELHKQDKQDYGLAALIAGVSAIDFDSAQDYRNLIDLSGSNRSLEVKVNISVPRTAPSSIELAVEQIDFQR